MNGLPAGGTFSGNGVSGNVFDPATAGLGTWPVVYSYTDGNGCSNSDTINVEVSTCDGIETVDLFEISLYPNPTSGKLVITLPDENGYSVSFTDALGKTILSEQIDGQKSAYLDLGSFAPGVYVLKVENAEGFALKRVVVE
ncbi:hypothetical protein SDC9_59740 [bioreactor metagenome]|uniref:Secretion system C-terminal sorting domain-containing protein n=1 Tax=bioreactor metagenome TaxID=1076179 RepID=A0A644XGU7_9ZZZZ